jgi:hypothetical protein
MPTEQLLFFGRDVLLPMAAVIGACVAVLGLISWNRRLESCAGYDLARRILKATYRLRDAIKSVRHPDLWGVETPAPPEGEVKHMTPAELTYYGTSRAYQARWQRVSDIRTKLQAELLEADVLWGAELRRRFEALFRLEHELFVAVHSDLSLRNPKESEAKKAVVRKRQMHARDIMHDSLEDGGDQFTRDLAHAIAPIEEYLKPHLRK